MSKYDQVLLMEAACCIWENMLEVRSRPSDKKGGLPTWISQMNDLWEKYGTVELRHKAISLAETALQTFDLIGGHEGMEELDLVPYDWGFMERFVSLVDWQEGTADPVKIAEKMRLIA